jgi:hypothetical protein
MQRIRPILFELGFMLGVLFGAFFGLMRHFRPEASTGVLVWWAFLSAVSIVNFRVWALSAAAYTRRVALEPSFASRRKHLVLSAVFMGVCAFRSFFPRADVQRICFFDTWLCSVMVGRAVATVAELSFVAQWALLLGEAGEEAGSVVARGVSKLILPLITVAEICSWYAVITTSYVGNAMEESIWTFTAALSTIALASLGSRYSSRYRPFFFGLVISGAVFVAFMCTVDVPMYLSRWRLDTAAGRTYFSLVEGLNDLWFRRVLTYSWSDWHEELAWMAGYFSAAVWGSILLVHAPRLERPKSSA